MFWSSLYVVSVFFWFWVERGYLKQLDGSDHRWVRYRWVRSSGLSLLLALSLFCISKNSKNAIFSIKLSPADLKGNRKSDFPHWTTALLACSYIEQLRCMHQLYWTTALHASIIFLECKALLAFYTFSSVLIVVTTIFTA